jgi:hypothetical protein
MLAAIGGDNEYVKDLYGEMTTGKIEKRMDLGSVSRVLQVDSQILGL